MVIEKITHLLKTYHTVLFMKGTRDYPMCGFSKKVLNILKHLEVDFHDVDILQDEELRQTLKEFSSWPTYPQLYINGELVGGCDIVSDLFETKKIHTLLGLSPECNQNL